MRKFLFISTVILLVLHMQGQEVVRFDTVHYNTAGSFAIGFSVFETDSGYLIFSNQKGVAGLSQDVYTTRFTQDGGIVSEQTVQTYRQDDWGNSSPMARIGERFYTGLTRFAPGSYVDSLFLYVYSGQGDTIATHFISADTTWVFEVVRRPLLATYSSLELINTPRRPTSTIWIAWATSRASMVTPVSMARMW